METQDNRSSQWAIARRIAAEIISGGIGLVFFHAVYLMVADWDKHLQRMNEQVFSEWWAGTMAWAIPIAYVLVGCAIAYRPWRRVGLWAALGYVILLCTYLTLGKLKIIEICSCIGFISSGGYWANMEFNGKLLAVILLVIALERQWLAKIRVYVWNRWNNRRRKEVGAM